MKKGFRSRLRCCSVDNDITDNTYEIDDIIGGVCIECSLPIIWGSKIWSCYLHCHPGQIFDVYVCEYKFSTLLAFQSQRSNFVKYISQFFARYISQLNQIMFAQIWPLHEIEMGERFWKQEV